MSAGKTGGTHTQVGHQSLTVRRGNAVQQLHRCRRQTGFLQSGQRFNSRQLRYARMAWMGLGQHRIPSRNGSGEVTAGYGTVGKGKVGGGQHNHRPQAKGRRADIARSIDHRQPP